MIGQTVLDLKGRPYHLTGIIGQGGEGIVYEESRREVLVKITTTSDPAVRTELSRRYRSLLEREIDTKVPLILPEAILAPPLTGYVMRRVPAHQPLGSLLHRPRKVKTGQWYHTDTGGLRRRLYLGAVIAHAFRELHLHGLAYCDLSDTNILVSNDLKKTSITLIDTDNLSVSGQAEALVLGTPRFMAPEILLGTHQPDSLSDSYSLGVLLFHLLRLGHPMLGDDVLDGSPDAEEDALRGFLPYIDHPEDESNRSSRVLPKDAICSQKLQDLFQRMFTSGITSRTRRPTPSEWVDACLLAGDSVAPCIKCSAEFFTRPISKTDPTCICPWCDSQQPMPLFLRIFDTYNNRAIQPSDQVINIAVRPGLTRIRQRHIRAGGQEFEDGGNTTVGQLDFNSDTDSVSLTWKGSDSVEILRKGETWKQIKSGVPIELVVGSELRIQDVCRNVPTISAVGRIDRIARLVRPGMK